MTGATAGDGSGFTLGGSTGATLGSFRDLRDSVDLTGTASTTITIDGRGD